MQLSIGLYFTSFISIAVLRLGLNGSVESDAVFNFLFHCRKRRKLQEGTAKGDLQQDRTGHCLLFRMRAIHRQICSNSFMAAALVRGKLEIERVYKT
jgi:hypothetical protein